MKNEYKQKREQGFTIIEVLIVLAIAALILLIVFLAVPALQRNSRNSSRRSDISNMLASINEFVSNNNGQTPGKVTGTTTLTWDLSAGGGTTSETKVGYYTGGPGTAVGDVNLVAKYTAPVTWNSPVPPSDDYAYIVIGGTCNSTNNGVVQGGTRAIAALYAIENGSNKWAAQCVSS